MRLLAAALVLSVAACSTPAGPEAAPSPEPTTPTGADALAVLDASDAHLWGVGEKGLGDYPDRVEGFSDELLSTAFFYGLVWVGAAQADEQVRAGDTEAFFRNVDPDGYLEGVREDVADDRAYVWMNVLGDGLRLVGEPRMRGEFASEKVVDPEDGEPELQITWKGSAVYAVEDAEGRGSLLPVVRSLTWRWREGWVTPDYDGSAEVGNADPCAITATGKLVPEPGDVDLEEEYLRPEAYVPQTDEEKAEQEAEVAACASSTPSA